MPTNDSIEKINKKRIELYNSEEYKIGSMIIKMKKLLKSLNLIEMFKLVRRHHKIKKLSSFPTEEYEMRIENKDKISNKKIVVYTCITGNYDNIIEPLFTSNNIDYIIFTDKQVNDKSIWKLKKTEDYNELAHMNYVEMNRFIKLNPYFLFEKQYDYSIYIDGNIGIVSDIRRLLNCINPKYGIAMHKHRNRNDIYKEVEVCKLLGKGNSKKMEQQINNYRKDNFPKSYGMLEANVIVADLKNNTGKKIMIEWWKEFEESKSERDQLSLIYVLWKNKISVDSIATLGSDVYKNPIFYIESHK